MSTLTPSRFGAFEDDASFEMPLPGLLADIDAAVGSVRMTDEFMEAPAKARWRLLQQWLREFQSLKDAAVVALYRESAETRPDLSVIEQIEAFKVDCHEAGLTCPGDLAVLLQRY